MNGPLDEQHTAASVASRLAASLWGPRATNAIRDGSYVDLQKAQSLLIEASEAVVRARARRVGVLPQFLYNLFCPHLTRYRGDGNRHALREAYGLLAEASVLMPGNDELTNRLHEIMPTLLRTLDPNRRADAEWHVALQRRLVDRLYRRADAEWHVALQRRLVDRLEGGFFAWANLAVALRNLWPHTRDDADLRALAEASEGAGNLAPHGSFAAVSLWEYSAQARLYLGAKDRDAADARRAAVAYEALAKHRPADANEREDEFVLWALARALSYELSGSADDGDAALAALRTLTDALSEPPTSLLVHAQDVLASLFPWYRVTGDTEVLNRVTEFGVWCVAHMDARAGALDFNDELAGLLNSLGVLLLEHPGPHKPPNRPLPWAGWTTGMEGRLAKRENLRVPGLAEAFARRFPFSSGPFDVSGPTGKLYLGGEFPLLVAEWQPTPDSPLRGQAVTLFQWALVFPPQSGQGAEPVFVPARIHIVTITLTAPDRESGIIEDMRVLVDSRDQAYLETVDSICSSGSWPTPMLNVFLDFEPPLLWPSPAPFTIPKSTTQTLVVRAVAEEHDVRWRLELAWRCGYRTGTFTIPLRTTGESGFRTFSSEGEVLRAPGYVIGVTCQAPGSTSG